MIILQRTAVALVAGATVFALLSMSNSAAGSRESVSQWTVVPKPSAMVHQMPAVPSRVVSFETTEGTFMSIDVSPDGETLIFDLLGDIYQMPFEGGDAVPVTTGSAWDQAPRFSQDGAHVYFLSDRVGHKNLWRLTLADHSLQKITSSELDILGGPNWSQDGSRLLAGVATPAEARSGEIILHSINPANGTMTPMDQPSGPWMDLESETREILRSRWKVLSGVEAADGKVYFSEPALAEDGSHLVVRLYAFDRELQKRTAITPADAAHNDFKPQLSHDGSLLAYFRQYNDRRTELRILNRTTGQDTVLVPLMDADDSAYTLSTDSRPNYSFTPDDRSVIFWHAGKIRRARLTDAAVEIVPFRVNVERELTMRVQPMAGQISDHGEATVIRWPSLSQDGQTMVFAAVGYVWVMDVPTNEVRRLSHSDEFEYMPAISPDGTSVAYISFAQSGDEYRFGRLMIADIDGQRFREVLAESNSTFLLPQWSLDGSRIALIRQVGKENGVGAIFGWTFSKTGAFHEVAPAPASVDIASLFVYARHVGFDATGEKLLFSYPQSLTKTVLAGANLDGSDVRTIAIGASDVGGITAAPDLKTLVLTRRDGSIWAVPFDVSEEPIATSSLKPDARRISRNGGYYVNWNGGKQLTFGFGQQVYRYRLRDGELQSRRISVSVARPKAAKLIAFIGARLITMAADVGAGPVIESGTVLVDGTRIAAIGTEGTMEIPAGSLVVDVTGKTIMPGLIDTHYHGTGGGMRNTFAFPKPNFSDNSAITYGVTSAWEPGGKVDDGSPAFVDLQAGGRVAGPRWSHAASGSVGYPYQFLTDYAAAQAAVARHRELGVTTLKEYLTPTRQQRQWLAAAARENGLGIVSHIQSYDDMMTRIIDGYTGGDHPSVPVPFYKDVRELLRQTGFIWTPNVDISFGSIASPDLLFSRFYYCGVVIQRQKQGDLSLNTANSVCNLDSEDWTETVALMTNYYAHRVSRVARQVALAASRGIHIGVSAHSSPAYNLHREMWILGEGGMPVEDVLRATCVVNAEKLGLQMEIGSLEVGKMADFLVLDENPLDDILNTLTLKYTVQGGVVFDSDTADRAVISEAAY